MGGKDCKTRGHEITSCLSKFVMTYFSNPEELVLWSDSYGGQFTFCLNLLAHFPNLKAITRPLPIPGHYFLPNDKELELLEQN